MKTHRPYVFLTLAFGAGIVLESFFPCPWAWLAAACWGLLFLAIIFRSFRGFSGAVFLMFFAALGALDLWVWQSAPPDDIRLSVSHWYGRPVTLEGVIASDLQVRSLGRGRKISFTLDVEKAAEQKASGKVLVVVFDPVDLRYGDRILVTGKLHRPFDYGSGGRLSYPSYLAQRKIYVMLTVKKGNLLYVREHARGSPLLAWALACRSRLNAVLERYLSPSEAGLMQALITGERNDVPAHVREIFFRTGTVHILAVSGMNVAMVAFGVFLVLNLLPVGRRSQMVLTAGLIAFYALMTGASAPVVRAAVMAIVFLFGFVLEREQDTVNSLFGAAFVILIFAPQQIFDAGFQLSFGSVLSILAGTPVVLGLLGIGQKRSCGLGYRIVEALAVSVAVMIGIGGLLVYYFQVVTPVALIANLPVIPLVALATALGCGVLLFGTLLPPIALLFAGCLKLTINLLVLILWGLSHVPWGAIFVPLFPAWGILGYYAAVVFLYGGVRALVRPRAHVGIAWQTGL